MHIYFGAFFALVALGAVGTLIWDGWQARARARSTVQNTIATSGTFIDDATEATTQRLPVSPQIIRGIAWLSILLMALIAPEPISAGYKGTILFCLLLAGLALAFYQSIPAPVSVAGGLLLLEFAVLFFAFADLNAFRLPSPFVLLAPVLGIFAYLRIARPYAKRRLPAVPVSSTGSPAASPAVEPVLSPATSGLHETGIFALVLLTFTTWQALELWAQRGSIWTIAAVAGVLACWLTLILHHRAEHSINAYPLRAYTIAAFLMIHWLLALSVWSW